MAKLTIEEAKLKLEPIEKAIKSLQSMNVEVPVSLTTEFDRLMKVINGNASANVANVFNENIAKQINGNEKFRNHLAELIGTKARLTVTVVTAEDGSKTIAFEASSSGGGTKTAGTSTGGGTKAATPYNHYVVTVNEAPETAMYAEKSSTTESASKCVEFILNKGTNPLNLGAEWQKGNSMVRALDGLLKNETFNKFFKLERTYVAAPAKEATAPATTDTAAPETAK